MRDISNMSLKQNALGTTASSRRGVVVKDSNEVRLLMNKNLPRSGCNQFRLYLVHENVTECYIISLWKSFPGFGASLRAWDALFHVKPFKWTPSIPCYSGKQVSQAHQLILRNLLKAWCIFSPLLASPSHAGKQARANAIQAGGKLKTNFGQFPHNETAAAVIWPNGIAQSRDQSTLQSYCVSCTCLQWLRFLSPLPPHSPLLLSTC